jgi:hypothetical protein
MQRTLNRLALVAIPTFVALLSMVFVSIASADVPSGRSQRGQTETLIGDIDSGYYVAPTARYSKVGTKDGLFAGVRGGWIINHDFVLGAAVSGLASTYQLPSDSLSFVYGGAMLEYIVASESLVHFSLNTVIGGGAVGPKKSTSPSGVFVVEPGLDVFVNLSRSIRTGLGVSYRLTRGTQVATLNDSDLSGVGANFLVQFGSF